MQAIARHCPQCKNFSIVEIQDKTQIHCPQCQTLWGNIKNKEDLFDRCPVCECRQFYLSKDFNQFLGCLIMGAGIILVPFSYGLSLPLFAFIDWLFYRRVKFVINCYRCGCEFRGFDADQKRFKPFMHHIGLKYDKYR